MLKLKEVVIGGIILVSTVLAVRAQDAVKPVKIEIPEVYSAAGGGSVRCYIYKPAVSKGVRPVIRIYAQNNQRGIPMLLRYKNGVLPVRLLTLAKNSQYQLAFHVGTDEILYTSQGKSPYTWKWNGRAKAPASPLVAIPDEMVKSIRWWAVVTTGNNTYTSDTLITIIQ